MIGTRNRWVGSRGEIVKFVASWGWELAFLTAVGIAIMLWQLPDFWADRSGVTDPQDRADLENSFRSTLAQIVGGFVLLVALYSTLRRVRAAERTVEITEQGQITERFTRAIEQLGAVHAPTPETAKEFPSGRPNIEVRLGGIYALERIARDSERDFWPIMEVLTAYVRENAPFVKPEEPAEQDSEADEGASNDEAEAANAPGSEGEADRSSIGDGSVTAAANVPPPKPRTDVQAVLTVIGRRVSRFHKPGEVIDLSGTDLRGAKLTGVPTENEDKNGRPMQFDLAGASLSDASLDRANLFRASLNGADLSDASLDQADLRYASLDGASLWDASLDRANLRDASLDGASLWSASLVRANLFRASLDGADLSDVPLDRANLRRASLKGATLYGAKMSSAGNLNQVQVDSAKGDSTTELPEDIDRPAHWDD